ncbi:MAG: sulfotransferase [Brevundimonas sp.]|nr:sulfotransferase [Brevundimonas sp.]
MADTAGQLIALASQLRAQGRAAEAADAYRRLLSIRPDLPDSWYNLALMERACGRFDAALGAYEQALRYGITGPEEVRLNRAVILADDLARHDLAQVELEAALAVAPDYLPALLNLGNLHEDLGQRDQARAAYERALAIEPDNALALARLTGLSRVNDPADPAIARLRAAIARSGRTAEDRAELGFALGKALDEAADYDAAFAAYADANAASRQAMPVRYDRARHEAFVEALIAAFPRPPVANADDQAAPVFVCGMFRSGSTLAEQILAGHSRVTPGGELGLVPAIARWLEPYPASLATRPDLIGQARDLYLRGLAASRPGAALVTDKRPDNFLHIGLIKAMFPKARIVHTVRDPLDTILSNWFLHLDGSMAHALDLDDMAHWHRQYRRLMAHWKALYPDILDLDYDALVRDPRPSIEALLGHLGLTWEDGVMNFHTARAGVRTASVWQVREPLYARSSGRWRNYEKHLGGLIASVRDDGRA